MSDSRIKDALFLLVRQGLWQRAESLPEPLFPLSEEEWLSVYIHSIRQSVQGITYDGVLLLPQEYYPSKKILLRWIADVDQWERVNKHHIEVLCSLQCFFENKPAISFEVIKGLALSQYYPNPFHRICGDIDTYWGSSEAVFAASRKLESAGVKVKYGATGDASCVINQVIIELHSELITFRNPFIQKRLRGWEKKVFLKVKQTLKPVYHGVEISVPIPEAHHILVSTHIFRHLTNEGIGLRQLCDAAILLKSLSHETNKVELEKLCREFGIYKWSCLLYSFLHQHLGLSEEYLPFTKSYSTETLFNEIWESGNMGYYDMRKGKRPEGKWKNKLYTVNQIIRKGKLFLRYAPGETFWWPTLLILKRLKEIFVKDERIAEKDNK